MTRTEPPYATVIINLPFLAVAPSTLENFMSTAYERARAKTVRDQHALMPFLEGRHHAHAKGKSINTTEYSFYSFFSFLQFSHNRIIKMASFQGVATTSRLQRSPYGVTGQSSDLLMFFFLHHDAANSTQRDWPLRSQSFSQPLGNLSFRGSAKMAKLNMACILWFGKEDVLVPV